MRCDSLLGSVSSPGSMPPGEMLLEKLPSQPAHSEDGDCHSCWFLGGLCIFTVAIADGSRGPIPSEHVIRGSAESQGQMLLQAEVGAEF